MGQLAGSSSMAVSHDWWLVRLLSSFRLRSSSAMPALLSDRFDFQSRSSAISKSVSEHSHHF